ncbi:MAG: YerC/YecD family TrpR-related protein [Eubacterium ventriosum]
MSKKIRNTEVDHLFDATLTLENKEECYTFFEDVCTVNELLSISQRYEVAKMLREGKTYLDISNATGAPTATIRQSQTVHLIMENDGHDMALERVLKKDE